MLYAISANLKEIKLINLNNKFLIYTHTMQHIVFILFYIGINLFRIIPFFILYFISYFVYFMLYYVLRYRKSLSISNLQKSFPKKSADEIKQIAKNFYKNNLSSIFVEGLKGFTMSEKQLKKRYHITNPEFLDAYFEQGKDIMALATHYGNWEWGIQAVNNQIRHRAAALYKPMSNIVIDKYTKKLREKHGMELVAINNTREYFETKKPEPVLYIMAADQNPSNTKKAYWVNFLNRKTACLHGPENYAKFNNLPVVFFDVERVKRGFYNMTIKPIFDNSAECSKGEITQKYMSLLEEAIYRKPENWLWSHRRWKHDFQLTMSNE